jgi:polysaccharide export outer membrane protein
MFTLFRDGSRALSRVLRGRLVRRTGVTVSRMCAMMKTRLSRLLAGSALASLALTGCAGGANGPQLPPASFVSLQEGPGEEYIIGPLDELTIFVWRNPELGASVQVRPDGRITTPLITDMPAVGKTPSMLAEDLKLQLSQYIQEPLVSVIVNKFAGANMTLLDAMIAVGGLNEFASGNRARLIRFDKQTGKQKEYSLRLADLLKKGDSQANVMLMPGDVIIIPESTF